MKHEWKQWEGFRKLHAIRLSQNDRFNYAIRGIAGWLNDRFVECNNCPPTTQIKERELNGRW